MNKVNIEVLFSEASALENLSITKKTIINKNGVSILVLETNKEKINTIRHFELYIINQSANNLKIFRNSSSLKHLKIEIFDQNCWTQVSTSKLSFFFKKKWSMDLFKKSYAKFKIAIHDNFEKEYRFSLKVKVDDKFLTLKSNTLNSI